MKEKIVKIMTAVIIPAVKFIFVIMINNMLVRKMLKNSGSLLCIKHSKSE